MHSSGVSSYDRELVIRKSCIAEWMASEMSATQYECVPNIIIKRIVLLARVSTKAC